jgi:hypothetical protein
MSWFMRHYQRRIVNVNVNIILAGVLALAVTSLVLHYAVLLGFETIIAQRAGVHRKLVIAIMTFVVDLIADVGVYYGLHWYANHVPAKLGGGGRLITPEYAHLSFMQDATMVQVERMVLSPILYTIALGTQHLLLRQGFDVATATATGFGSGIAVSRCLHTMWMLYRERRLKTGPATGAEQRTGGSSAQSA